MASRLGSRSTPSFNLDLSRGLISGLTSNHKFGYNGSVNTTEQPVWAESSVSYAYPAAAATVTISSDNAADTSAGTGARTVYIEGLSSTWATTSETLTLNGTTAVTSANSYIRINRAYVVTVGSGGVNTGIVYIGTGSVTAGKPAVVLASLVAGRGQTLQAIYTVPLGYTAYVVMLIVSASGNANARFYQRQFGGSFRVASDNFVGSGSPFVIYHYEYAGYPAKTDLEIRAASLTGTVGVSAEFEMILVAT